jgi:FtsP/CotA-like multicopper oxidase with cupredoxin domain
VNAACAAVRVIALARLKLCRFQFSALNPRSNDDVFQKDYAMQSEHLTRRRFIKLAGAATGGVLLGSRSALSQSTMTMPQGPSSAATASGLAPHEERADHTIRIGTGLVEVGLQRGLQRILSTATYNGQFPGPLLRLKEGRRVVVDIHNDTDAPEQLHWHGQFLSTEVDGAAEEGTPFIPAHGMRRIAFTPRPSGFRFYHTHLRAGSDLHGGLYGGQVGPVYIEAKHEPGAYDREVFLTLKEFEPFFMRGGDMAMDFLAPATIVPDLKEQAKKADKEAAATPKGYEVGYRLFTINGRMLGHGEPISVKRGERVLFHILNGSATEIRSLALPGHTFKVVALDGNPVPTPVSVPVLWLGTAERVSAIVEMNHPGVWMLGDLADKDRNQGMGIVVEYAGRKGKPQWVKPAQSRWDYSRFGKAGTAVTPDEVIEMTFAKQRAAAHGFNLWTINGVPFDMEKMKAMFHLRRGRRYRLRMRNASDDIHPVHLHRHSFELTKIAGKSTSGVIKDVVMLGAYQEMEVDFTADQPGLTLFHCHMQLHMDYGFMALFDCV